MKRDSANPEQKAEEEFRKKTKQKTTILALLPYIDFLPLIWGQVAGAVI